MHSLNCLNNMMHCGFLIKEMLMDGYSYMARCSHRFLSKTFKGSSSRNWRMQLQIRQTNTKAIFLLKMEILLEQF